MAKMIAICGCGGRNYCTGDWLSHWQFGRKRDDALPMYYKDKQLPMWIARFLYHHPKFRAVYFFLTTQIVLWENS